MVSQKVNPNIAKALKKMVLGENYDIGVRALLLRFSKTRILFYFLCLYLHSYLS